MHFIFYDCVNLIDFSPVANWDTSNIHNMRFAFAVHSNGYKVNNPVIDFSNPEQ